MGKLGQRFLTPILEVLRGHVKDAKFNILSWLQCDNSFFKIYKEIFNMKEAWKSPNTLPTMVHIQAYHIIN
jgi:hypothetical protein